MWGISYWAIPIFSSLVWLAMLLALLITWSTDGFPHYPSMNPGQHIAYISDIGAQKLKPLFIAMSAVTVVSFDLAFIVERWLRHTGRLVHNTSWFQKTCSFISIIAAIAGAAGLILLSIFDTLRHPHLHDDFLALFIGGYIVSAIFICIEYQRLGIHFREHSVLRYSFWIKLFFILFELALAIAFGVSNTQGKYNVAAVLEWVISFIYFFYVLSFFIDFMPAVRTKHHQSRETEMDVAVEQGAATHSGDESFFRHGRTNGGYANGDSTNAYVDNGYANSRTNINGYASHPNHRGINGETYYPDGHPNNTYKPANEPVPASRNF